MLKAIKSHISNKFLLKAFANSGQTFANTARQDPYKSFNYRVTITGKKNFAKMGFQKVTGLQASTEASEYRDGNDSNLNVRKSAGLTSFEPVTLTRGMSEDKDMFDWYLLNTNTNGNSGQMDENMQCSVKIELMDRDRTVVKYWELIDAWPSEWSTGDFDAQSNDVMLENLVLQHNGIKHNSN